MKTNLKISVIIPILNEEASLKQLLDNLLKQTLKPDEILICDTGSSDNSILIIGDNTLLIHLIQGDKNIISEISVDNIEISIKYEYCE